MVYAVLGIFEKKNLPYVRLKWRLETSFGNPYQKSADTLNFAFTHVSCTSQQKKVSTISHVRETEGLTNYCFIIKYITFQFSSNNDFI